MPKAPKGIKMSITLADIDGMLNEYQKEIDSSKDRIHELYEQPMDDLRAAALRVAHKTWAYHRGAHTALLEVKNMMALKRPLSQMTTKKEVD